jgi:hypothetical protein
MVKGGFFKDSKENRSLYLGPVYQYKLTNNFHLGGGLLLFDSETYVSPVIPLPLVTYRYKRVRLNGTWVPAGDSSASAAFAIFVTIGLWEGHYKTDPVRGGAKTPFEFRRQLTSFRSPMTHS